MITNIPDTTIRVQKTQYVGGYAWSGPAPEAPPDRPHPERLDTDFRVAAKSCLALSLVEPEAPFCLRTALRITRCMRAEAGNIINANRYLLVAIAEELLLQRELDQARLSRFLK